MQQVTTVPIFPSQHIPGTGGFLDPDRIVDMFNVKRGAMIADFGCGSGYFTISLAAKTGPEGRVYALDVLENALDMVRAKARMNGLDNIETIRTNLENKGSSSLSDDSMDIVLLANVLFQSKAWADIIEEGRRILKSKGEFIIIDWKKGTGGFGPPDNIRPDPDELKRLAQQSNLIFGQPLETGQFHFGLIFSKS